MQTIKLGEIISTLKGFAFKTGWMNSAGIPLVKVSNFTDNSISLQGIGYIQANTAPLYTKYQLQRGDILIQTVGSWPSAPASVVGKVVSVPKNLEGALLNQNIVKIIPNAGINNSFLYYLLKNESFKNYLIGGAQGAASQASITLEHIKNYELVLPDNEAQEKIASILSAYDDLIENNNRRIEILEQTAQEIYKEWFVNFRFPGHETIKMIDSETDFGEIPEGWKVEILGEQVTLIKGVSYKSSELSDDQGVDFINLKCFNRGGGFRIDGLKKYTGKFKESQNIKVGDIVMAVTDMTQNREVVARVALVPRTKEINQFTLSCDVIKIDPIRISKDYLYFVLRFSEFSGIYKTRANGANVLHLRPDEIKDFHFLLPTPEILEKFIEIIANITQEIDVLNIQIDNLKKTRDILLPKLITGEIDVSELEIK